MAKRDPGATKRCDGVLALEQIQGCLVTNDDKKAHARCPKCDWTGYVPVARANRLGSGRVTCLQKPPRTPAQQRATATWRLSGAMSLLAGAHVPYLVVPGDAGAARAALGDAEAALRKLDRLLNGPRRDCAVTGGPCDKFPACREGAKCKDEWMNEPKVPPHEPTGQSFADHVAQLPPEKR